jgi:putative GTP pyrophosphokinase
VKYTPPNYSRSDVNRAGAILRQATAGDVEGQWAVDVLDNWRAAHAYPLNTFQVVLAGRAHEVDRAPLLAQRLKRVPSILAKLHKRQTMRLAQMQDIGGCRAVVRDLNTARRLRRLHLVRRSAAEYVGGKDYIAEPAASGYRSFHLIFRYHSARAHLQAWDGLQVEIQIRSQLQHAWATAVETVGTIIGQALKSSEGDAEWLDLMRHISSVFAHAEGSPPVPDTPPHEELLHLVRERAEATRLAFRLEAFRNALRVLDVPRRRRPSYFLLKLNAADESLHISPFGKEEIDKATEAYLAGEREAAERQGLDVVLVAAESMDALRRAYPNYFLDTEVFLEKLASLTQSVPRATRKRGA